MYIGMGRSITAAEEAEHKRQPWKEEEINTRLGSQFLLISRVSGQTANSPYTIIMVIFF